MPRDPVERAVLAALQAADGGSLGVPQLRTAAKEALKAAGGDKAERRARLDAAVAALAERGKVAAEGETVTLCSGTAAAAGKRRRSQPPASPAADPAAKRPRTADPPAAAAPAPAAAGAAAAGVYEIFVRYLPYSTTPQQLREFFAEAGEIVADPTLLTDPSGRCKGAGWVSFATEAAMWEAVSWSGCTFGNRHLDITKAKKYSHGHTPTVQAPGTHTPALLGDVLRRVVAGDRDGTFVDGTFGRGGHTRQILAQLSPKGRLHAFDLDPEAIEVGRKLEKEDSRFTIHHAPFSTMAKVMRKLGIHLSGVLLDLGISSPQFDDAHRGFRPEQDGPLDLRFDQTKGEGAAELLRTAPREELMRILREYGDGTDAAVARRMADAVCVLRQTGQGIPSRTKEFAALCERVKGKDYQQMHPAKLIFQAIRIHLNDEFGELRRGLKSALDSLSEKGRIGIISWKHSECAIVMDFVRRNEFVRPDFPLKQWYDQQEGAQELRKTWGVVMEDVSRPSEAELKENSRSRSALLHVLVKGKGVRVADLEKAAYPLLGWDLSESA